MHVRQKSCIRFIKSIINHILMVLHSINVYFNIRRVRLLEHNFEVDFINKNDMPVGEMHWKCTDGSFFFVVWRMNSLLGNRFSLAFSNPDPEKIVWSSRAPLFWCNYIFGALNLFKLFVCINYLLWINICNYYTGWQNINNY